MTFHSAPKDIGTADTLIFECPATLEGSVHGLQFENYSSGAAELTIKLFKFATGVTSTVRVRSLAGGEEYAFTKINVAAGDRVLAAADTAGAIRGLANAYVDSATPAAVGFTPRGEWLVGSTYAVNDVVTRLGSSYIARVANSGSQPPSANWMVLAEKGQQGDAGEGAGDMITATYDPNGIGANVFDMENMVEGTTKKILTAAERTKLGGISNGATANDTDANLKNRSNHTGTQAASTITGLAPVATSGSAEDLTEGASKKLLTTTERTKLGQITVTQPVDLDAIESRVNELDAAIILKGTWDASTGTFPGAGAAQAGWSYIVSVGGTVNGVAFNANDRLIAIADNASTSTFASNWFKADYTDAVLTVDGATGTVTVGAILAAAASKATPVDADKLGISDSAASNGTKHVTFANLKAWIWTALGSLISGGTEKTTPVDADTFALADSAAASATKKLTWANIKAALNGLYVRLAADGALTAGFTATAVNDGTKSSGTYTPTPAGGNLKRAVNGGAHTLAAPTAAGDYTLVIQYTNNASAGAITLSGFSKTSGTFTTIDGDDFMVYIAKVNGFTHANVVALQ